MFKIGSENNVYLDFDDPLQNYATECGLYARQFHFDNVPKTDSVEDKSHENRIKIHLDEYSVD